MPIKKVKSEFKKLSAILDEDLIADECTAGELKQIHDQLQEAIKSGDPAQLIRDKKIAQQLVLFEETNPIVGKMIKDLITALSGMGIQTPRYSMNNSPVFLDCSFQPILLVSLRRWSDFSLFTPNGNTAASGTEPLGSALIVVARPKAEFRGCCLWY